MKILAFQEQKLELIEILNSKNQEWEELQKESSKAREEYEDKIQKQLSTKASSSPGYNQSDSIMTLFKLMNIKNEAGIVTENDLRELMKKWEQLLSLKKGLENDNKQLRQELDKVIVRY